MDSTFVSCRGEMISLDAKFSLLSVQKYPMQLHAYGQSASTATSLTNFELMDVLAVLGLPKLAGFSVEPVASKVRTQFAIKLR